MIAANSLVVVDVHLKYTDWHVRGIRFLGVDGTISNGTISLLDVPSGDRATFRWHGTFTGEGWFVSGDGAKIGAGRRVPNPASFPFSLNTFVNKGIQHFVTDWLAKNVDRPKLPTNGHSVAKEVSSVVQGGDVKVSVKPAPEATLPVGGDVLLVSTTRGDGSTHGNGSTKLGESAKPSPSGIVLITPPVPAPLFVGTLTPARKAVEEPVKERNVTVELVKSEDEQYYASLIPDFDRGGNTILNISNALQREIDSGKTIPDLSREIGKKSGTTVTNFLALQRLHPSLKPLLDHPTARSDRIPIIHGTILARVDPSRQVEVWFEAKKQRNKRLVLSKIHELGKPHFVRMKGENRQIGRGGLPGKVSRRFERINIALTELESFGRKDYVRVVIALGLDRARLALKNLDEFTRRISDARAGLATALEKQKQAQ